MTSLRQRMIEDMQVRNLAPNTQQGYVRQVFLFARHFRKSPELLEPEQIRAYLLYLANEKKLSRSTMVIATSALRFLYKVTLKTDWSVEEVIPVPKKPQKLPVILSPEEVREFLDCVQGKKHRAILTTCYAAGLRLSEAVALTPSAIDSKHSRPSSRTGGAVLEDQRSIKPVTSSFLLLPAAVSLHPLTTPPIQNP